MGTTSIQAPDDMMKRLESTAALLPRSRGGYEVLRECLARKRRSAQRLEGTCEALAEVDAGNLIDGDEVLACLDGWGDPDERERLSLSA